MRTWCRRLGWETRSRCLEQVPEGVEKVELRMVDSSGRLVLFHSRRVTASGPCGAQGYLHSRRITASGPCSAQGLHSRRITASGPCGASTPAGSPPRDPAARRASTPAGSPPRDPAARKAISTPAGSPARDPAARKAISTPAGSPPRDPAALKATSLLPMGHRLGTLRRAGLPCWHDRSQRAREGPCRLLLHLHLLAVAAVVPRSGCLHHRV